MADLGALEEQYGLPTGLLSAVQKQESGGDPNAVSPAGALGAFQFMPATAKQYGIDPLDPEQAAAGAARMYADLSKKYNGDVPTMLAAYNWGQGNVDKYGIDKAPAETRNYIKSITSKLGAQQPQGTQYAQADTGTMSDMPTDTSLPDLSKLSDEELNALEAHVNSQAAPTQMAPDLSKLSDAELDALDAKISTTSPPNFMQREKTDLAKRKQQIEEAAAAYHAGDKSIGRAVLDIAGAYGGGIGDTAGNIVGSAARQARDYIVPREEMQKQIGDWAREGASAVGDTQIGKAAETGAGYLANKAQELAKNYPDTTAVAGDVANIASVIPVVKGVGVVGKEAASIAPEMANAVLKAPGTAAEAIATKLAPQIPEQTAQLVKDAADLGINIPPRVFNPTGLDKGLKATGLASKDTMKADTTTALSQAMGHEGTPNLDVPTIKKIQDDIGSRMNDFALKADEKGGIPLTTQDLNGIAEDSFANETQVKKLIRKITERMKPDETISGADYQELTKKGSALDRAMNSSDSELADTAKELRAHLDNQLEGTVNPEDLKAFQEARRQWRTMKIVQPLVEKGGVLGQPDSAAKLYNAVVSDYGSMQNALKYNKQLGTIAQIANEFPEAIEGTPKTSLATKVAKLSTAPGAVAGATLLGIPATTGAAIVAPAAGVGKLAGMYRGSEFYKNAILGKSLPEVLAETQAPTAANAPEMLRLPPPATITPPPSAYVPKQIAYQPPTDTDLIARLGEAPRAASLNEQNAANAARQRAAQLGLTSDVRSVLDKNAKEELWSKISEEQKAVISRQIEQMYNENKMSVRDTVKEANQRAADLAEAKAESLPVVAEAFKKSLGRKKGGIIAEEKTKTPTLTHRQWVGYLQSHGRKNKHTLKDKNNPKAQAKAANTLAIVHGEELKTKLGRDPKPREVELAHYITPYGVHRLLKAKNGQLAAHKMFPAEIVKDQRSVFFNGRKPYTIEHIRKALD